MDLLLNNGKLKKSVREGVDRLDLFYMNHHEAVWRMNCG